VKISEIFYSIQGEGPNIGVPSVFLRLAVCNLKCSWCDTKYSWDWEHYDYDKEVTEMDADEAAKKILGYDSRHLVVTGGEPMLQQEELFPVLRNLGEKGFFIEVETNGTMLPTGEISRVVDQWNVSPKLANSGNSLSAREKSECYNLFGQLSNSYFKFVVENSEDLGEILELVAKYGIPRDRVILMPESTSPESLREKSAWLAEVCRSEGFRFTTRLHIILYGNKRGV
jgi:7-carboxy-7-deazaguanine synthase